MADRAFRILTASDERLGRLRTLDEVRNRREYTIEFSAAMKDDVSQIWKRLQAGKLHNHPLVLAENMRAARVVRELFLVYAVNPKLISSFFRQSHASLSNTDYMKWYRTLVGGKSVGIPKRLLTRYSYEHTIGANLTQQGDNWLVPIEDVVLARDYVASLTDSTALNEYRTHCSEAA